MSLVASLMLSARQLRCHRARRGAKRASPQATLKNGALAQLGERLICIQEVRSSILLGSTIKPGERSSQKRSGGSFLGIDAKQPCCAAGLRLVMVDPRIYYAPIRKRIGGWLPPAHRRVVAVGKTNTIIKPICGWL